jgi:hypothetical protein
VPDPFGGEQLAQRAVADIAPVVVAHQTPDHHPVGAEEGERALAESGDVVRLLVGVELGIGQARVVVDDRVANS